MKTLYDLLNALPDDDAESLRAAFRKAAKANHPDNNPGEPDAPLRFRRIVRRPCGNYRKVTVIAGWC